MSVLLTFKYDTGFWSVVIFDTEGKYNFAELAKITAWCDSCPVSLFGHYEDSARETAAQ